GRKRLWCALLRQWAETIGLTSSQGDRQNRDNAGPPDFRMRHSLLHIGHPPRLRSYSPSSNNGDLWTLARTNFVKNLFPSAVGRQRSLIACSELDAGKGRSAFNIDGRKAFQCSNGFLFFLLSARWPVFSGSTHWPARR